MDSALIVGCRGDDRADFCMVGDRGVGFLEDKGVSLVKVEAMRLGGLMDGYTWQPVLSGLCAGLMFPFAVSVFSCCSETGLIASSLSRRG